MSRRFNNSVLVSCLILLGSELAAGATTAEYDVVVYGATPAGICAAIAAEREGQTACLVEPLNLVGGMMSSGLSFSDSNQTAREYLLGLFEEIHGRIEQSYADLGTPLPYRVSVKDQAHWTYEPHVAESVFSDLLREAGVQVLLERQLESAKLDGPRITDITTTGGRLIRGRVFVDASYEGDLLASAGVTYRVGREAPDVYQETLAGQQFPKPSVAVSPWNQDGSLLPLMSSRNKGEQATGDHRIMTYSFRLCLSEDPENRIPFTEPADYDPATFELLRRYFAKYPDAEFPVDLYPIPGGKFDANNGIAKQISLGLVGANWEWPDASAERRQQIWLQHKSYTEGLFCFLVSDPAVPAKVRERARRLGWAKDEFTRFGHWPPVLYIREARRMVGEYVLTEADVLRNVHKSDPVAVGSFPIDSHDCQRIPTDDGGFVNEGTIFPRHIEGRAIGQPYEVPYRCLTPQADECENLLVPVCLSSSHVAFSSVRVEPTWIVLGQASGIAAAMASRDDVPVQRVDYSRLKSRLEAQNMAVSLDSAQRDTAENAGFNE